MDTNALTEKLLTLTQGCAVGFEAVAALFKQQMKVNRRHSMLIGLGSGVLVLTAHEIRNLRKRVQRLESSVNGEDLQAKEE